MVQLFSSLYIASDWRLYYTAYTTAHHFLSDEGPTLETLNFYYPYPYPYQQYTNLFIFRFELYL